jgi:D-hexose-6-phosphate mutarotase
MGFYPPKTQLLLHAYLCVKRTNTVQLAGSDLQMMISVAENKETVSSKECKQK